MPAVPKTMPRKLKTYVSSSGFFDLAVAAPSMKAALEAWGMSRNAFQQGFAQETDDPKIIAAATAQPGVVLKRPVGTKGEYKVNAELPRDLPSAAQSRPHPKPKLAPKTKNIPERKPDAKADRAAIVSFEKEKAKRESERDRDEEIEDRRREKRALAVEKAQAEFDRAADEHKKATEEIDAQRDKLDRRAALKDERWEGERQKLKAAIDKAKQQ
ncbi:MAG: cell envelope biogenesis protein TolA [Chthoniobacterales bacterium]|nr:cell envelope biogenesis protein TolA [Chthoniobacterales bacterium]